MQTTTDPPPSSVSSSPRRAAASSAAPEGHRPLRPEVVELSFEPGRLVARLAGIVSALTVLHVVTVVCHHRYRALPWALRGMFDLDEEQGFGTWFSSALLLLAALAALVCARRAVGPRRAERLPWRLLAAGFTILSIDEVVGMHESFQTVVEFSWAIPGGILAAVCGAAFVPFLRRLPRRTAVLLVLAGCIHVSGAVGVEYATTGYETRGELDTLEYDLTTVLEEAMEMAGVILFVLAALRHATSRGPVTVTVTLARDIRVPPAVDPASIAPD